MIKLYRHRILTTSFLVLTFMVFCEIWCILITWWPELNFQSGNKKKSIFKQLREEPRGYLAHHPSISEIIQNLLWDSLKRTIWHLNIFYKTFKAMSKSFRSLLKRMSMHLNRRLKNLKLKNNLLSEPLDRMIRHFNSIPTIDLWSSRKIVFEVNKSMLWPWSTLHKIFKMINK